MTDDVPARALSDPPAGDSGPHPQSRRAHPRRRERNHSPGLRQRRRARRRCRGADHTTWTLEQLLEVLSAAEGLLRIADDARADRDWTVGRRNYWPTEAGEFGD